MSSERVETAFRDLNPNQNPFEVAPQNHRGNTSNRTFDYGRPHFQDLEGSSRPKRSQSQRAMTSTNLTTPAGLVTSNVDGHGNIDAQEHATKLGQQS